MSKRKRPPNTPISAPNEIIGYSVDDLMAQAVNVSENLQTIYANHVQFSINANEIFIDFYRFEPDPRKESPKSLFLQRIAIPNAMGKGFAEGMANLVDIFEKTTGITLPLQRDRGPEDTMVIWK